MKKTRNYYNTTLKLKDLENKLKSIPISLENKRYKLKKIFNNKCADILLIYLTYEQEN